MVTIEIEHSLELAVAMCAVQIAGACAVPVDPAIGSARRAAIFADVDPPLSLTTGEGPSAAIAIESRAPHEEGGGCEADLAFVVYTSGSTGGPKGVAIPHESYVRRMRYVVSSIEPRGGDTDLAWTPSSFIGMLDDFFLPLLLGVPAIIAAPAIRSNPDAFAALVREEGVTSFRTTPSLLSFVLKSGAADGLRGVRTIVCSGETVSPELQTLVHEQLSATLTGFYGATEAPAVAFQSFERGTPPQRSTLCTPQPFVRLRVALEDGTTVEDGTAGEMWIGGGTIARGYHRRPELTARSFVERDGTRWYRTGDLARRLTDGRLEILGRADTSETNINGTRVSLPETLETLRAAPGVADGWVGSVRRDGKDRQPGDGPSGRQSGRQSDPILFGYCVMVPGAAFDISDLRRDLAARLPSPAVPAILLEIDEMPLTDNGKIDAQRLRDAAVAHLAGGTDRRGAATAAPAESAMLSGVVEVAEKILDVRGIAGEDGFFAAGGDSLHAIRYALALSERFGMDVRTSLVTNSDSFAAIARMIAKGKGQSAFRMRTVREGRPGTTPLVTLNDSRRYEVLAPQMAATCPIQNLNMFGITEDLLDDVENFELAELAAIFADEIERSDPTGPWRLVAFCQHGALAIEIARFLQHRSGLPPTLLLIDTFFTEHNPTRRVQLMRLIEMGPLYYLRKIPRRFGRTPEQIVLDRMPTEERITLVEKGSGNELFYRRYQEHFARYRPDPYDGAVTLFVSREFRHTSRTSARRLAGERLRIRDVNGLHRSLFDPGNGDGGLAEHLNAEIEELQLRGL